MFMENKKTTHKEEISRKDAIKKMGKYAALTAIGSFAILNPKKAQATSAPTPPGSGWWCMQVTVRREILVETTTTINGYSRLIVRKNIQGTPP